VQTEGKGALIVSDEKEIIIINRFIDTKGKIGEATRTRYWDITCMEIDWIKTKNRKNNYDMKTLRMDSLTLEEHVGVKPCSIMDNIHAIMEMEYLYTILPNSKAYYLIHRLQVCFQVDVIPPMIKAHIFEKQLLVMWKIDNLEWKKSLSYNIIYYYIQYHESHGYGIMEFIMGSLGIYAL
jgi:hypothetical protein